MTIWKLTKNDWDTVKRLSRYSGKNLKESFNHFVKKGLRHNDVTGKTYVGNELLGQFSKKSDIEKYDNKEEAIRWAFMGFINNGASRLERGYLLNPCKGRKNPGKTQPGTFGMRNGKLYKKGNYRKNSDHRTKNAAEREARKLRRQGYIATVKKGKKGYASYVGLSSKNRRR
jgi:hypothetical protein